MNQLPPVAIFCIALLLFLAFWCGLLTIIGRISGWLLLADRYRFHDTFDGQCWYLRSAELRWQCSYGGALTVGANPSGLYLAVLAPFRPGHPPLFIPWSETQIQMVPGVWFGPTMEIHFPEVPGTLIRFSRSMGQRIAAAAKID